MQCLANGLANLAAYLVAMDYPIEARAAAREALIRAQETQSRFLVVISIEHLAVASAIRGEGEAAARLLGFGDAHYGREGIAREPTERIGYEQAKALLLDRLGPQRFDAAIAQGKRLTEENAIEDAFKL